MATHKLTDNEKDKLNKLLTRVVLAPRNEHPHGKEPVELPLKEGLTLAMLRAGLRKSEFAKMIGVDKAAISRYLAGVYNPHYENYLTIIMFCAKWNVKLMEVK